MKITQARLLAVSFFTLASAGWAHNPQASAASAKASLKGNFILAEDGGAGTNKIASLGVLTFDGAGNVAGTQFVQMAGNARLVPVTGTYTIGADGGGSLVLATQLPAEDGPVPTVTATYEFLRTSAAGFAAIRRDGSLTTLAHVIPAGTAKGFDGDFIFEGCGTSVAGQSRAEIATLKFRTDGTLSGKLVISNGAIQDPKAVTGSYAPAGNGLWSLRFVTPGETDEQGNINLDATSYYAAETSKGEMIAVRADGTLIGLATIR
jgi:hypothetical protein